MGLSLGQRQAQAAYIGSRTIKSAYKGGKRFFDSGGGSAYTGPLDLVPGALVAYGVRALSAAMLGQNIFRLRRDSDNAEMDFAADATNGDAPVADIVTWLGEANGYLTMLYDQSGSEFDMAPPSLVWQPLFVLDSGLNGRCGFVKAEGAEGADVITEEPASPLIFPNGAASMFMVAGAGVGGANFYNYASDNSYISFLLDFSGSIIIDIFDIGTSREAGGEFTAFSSGIRLVDAGWEFGAKSVYVNGSSIAAAVDYDTIGAVPSITANAYSNLTLSQSVNVPFCEGIFYAQMKSPEQRTPGRQNIATYYNITLP